MSSQSNYRVLARNQSPFCRVVYIVFEELGLEYEKEYLQDGASKSPEYIATNHPFGQVPVLIDGDFRLFESQAILRYIANKHEAEELYPKDAKKRALVDQWLSVAQTDTRPILEVVLEFLIGPKRGKPADEAKLPSLAENLNKLLSILDNQLSKSKYFAGENFTLADVVLAPAILFLFVTPNFEKVLDSHPHLKSWVQTVSQRPSFQKTAAL